MAQLDDDWQSKCPAKDRTLHLLRTGLWSDCKFLVGEQEKMYFDAHKLVLASASRVFEAMFYGGMAETREVIDITDIQPEPFKAMLEYIYSDVINVKTLDEACMLYCCADKYNLKHLAEGCLKFLAANLQPENACQIYEFAKMFNENHLMLESLRVIQNQTTDVLSSDSFLDAKLTTVLKIFSFSILNLNSELEIFEAAESYANAVGEERTTVKTSRKRKLPPDDDITEESELENMENEGNGQSTSYLSETESNISLENSVVIDKKKKEVFRKIAPSILFLTMTPKEFANRISRSPYLTESECYGLLMNIVSDTTHVPVPDGFSNQRKPRYKLITNPECYADLSTDKAPTRTEAVFTVTVPKFKKIKQISLPSYVRNMPWRVAVDPQPNVNEPKQKSLGVYLTMTSFIKQTINFTADIEIGVVQRKTNAHRVLKKTSHFFNKSATIGAIISLHDEMFDPKKGYVTNNSIKITVSVKTREKAENESVNNTRQPTQQT